MHAHAETNSSPKTIAAAGDTAERASSPVSLPAVDDISEAIAQPRIQEIANQSTQVKQLQAYQSIANHKTTKQVSLPAVPALQQKRQQARTAGIPPVQRMLALNNEDSRRLEPEYLQGTLHIEPPQLYKDLFYQLDDLPIEVKVGGGITGSFEQGTKTISLAANALEYPAGRIIAGEATAADIKKFRTAMAQFGHEMQHAVDYIIGGKKDGLDKDDGTEEKYLAVMDTELRAWATEAIVYKKYGAEVNDEGRDLIAGWAAFDPGDIDKTDEALISNVIWARIKQYSTKNKIGTLPWRDCAKTGNVLVRAVEEKNRVAAHVDIQTAPEAMVTIETLSVLNSDYSEFKAAGTRVKKVRKVTEGEGDAAKRYYIYKYKRREYKVLGSVVTDNDLFNTATGSW